MPQFNPEFFVSQLFWLVVFFSFLFVFLWRVSLPRIATVPEKRQNKIDENLSNAKKLQEEAKEIEVNINEKIQHIEDRYWAEEIIKKKLRIIYEPKASVYHWHGVNHGMDKKRVTKKTD